MEQLRYLNNIQFKGEKKLLVGIINPIKKTILKIIADNKKEIEYIYFNIISNKELLEINKKHLNHNYFTDVITFNYSNNTKTIEGDSYISIDFVKSSAKELNINPKEEIKRIIIHSVLHMVGFEDIKKQEKEKMTKLENKYLKLLESFHVEQNKK